MSGLVSVIIPTYNRYDSLNRAIQSVHDQTYKNVEIIVINDGSDDPRYLSLNSNGNTTVIHLPLNLRKRYRLNYDQAHVRNIGLAFAKGEWIAFLDDDDWWCRDKLEIQLGELAKYPDHLFCSSNMTNIHAREGYSLGPHLEHYGNSKCIANNIFSTCLDDNVYNNYILNSTVIFSKKLLAKTGPLDHVTKEDWRFWQKILRHTNCLIIDKPLANYRYENTKYYKYDW